MHCKCVICCDPKESKSKKHKNHRRHQNDKENRHYQEINNDSYIDSINYQIDKKILTTEELLNDQLHSRTGKSPIVNPPIVKSTKENYNIDIDLLPKIDKAYSLGSETLQFLNLYISGVILTNTISTLSSDLNINAIGDINCNSILNCNEGIEFPIGTSLQGGIPCINDFYEFCGLIPLTLESSNKFTITTDFDFERNGKRVTIRFDDLIGESDIPISLPFSASGFLPKSLFRIFPDISQTFFVNASNFVKIMTSSGTILSSCQFQLTIYPDGAIIINSNSSNYMLSLPVSFSKDLLIKGTSVTYIKDTKPISINYKNMIDI
jgi:hypothetical protein